MRMKCVYGKESLVVGLGKSKKISKSTTIRIGCSFRRRLILIEQSISMGHMKTLVSWNVNGIRAAEKKGLFEWFERAAPDVLCLQETKAHPDQLPEKYREQAGYEVHFASAARRGYSGVAVYAKYKPLSVRTLGKADFDSEGRVLLLEYPEFLLINAYFPNSQEEGARLSYKLDFCKTILDLCVETVKKGGNIVLCGDYNISHKPIDLARPKDNEGNPGYLPEERAWLDEFQAAGFVDTFRMFNQEGGNYSWWTYRFNAREKNVGWRLDYFWVNQAFSKKVKEASILKDVYGSDHCPVSLVLDVE